MKYVATRMIDHPLGSGVWAFAEGEEVPEASVKAQGYDNPDNPYVQAVDAPAPATPGPASETEAEAAKPAE